MRPLKLELEGFTAFRQRTVLDLEEPRLDLFAITGPTGAGKSSLIDAVAYALYGRVPRVENQVGACISQGLERMYVQLEFLAGLDRYRVFRETRSSGQRNIRLERWVGEEWAPLVGGAGQVNSRIQQVVGLDFDGFTRSVLLPQGQFQEFLAGSPVKRREVLGHLLRLEIYEGVRSRASRRASELHGKISTTQQMLQQQYADATPETVAGLSAELELLRAEAARLATEVEQLGQAINLARDVARARGDLEQARRERTEIAKKQRAVQELVGEGDEQLQTLGAALREIQAKLEANRFDPDRLAALTLAARIERDVGQVIVDLERTRTALTEKERELQQASKSVASMKRQLDEIVASCQAAAELLRAAVKGNAAAVVQEGLASGGSCPVCGGVVRELPHIDCPDLEESRTKQEKAQQKEAEVRDAISSAQAQLASAAASHEAEQRRVDELQSRQEQLRAELAGILPDEERSRGAIQQALRGQEEAHKERTHLEQRERGARDALDSLRKTLEQARGELEALRAQANAAEQNASKADAEFKAALEALRSLAAGTAWRERIASVDAGGELEGVIQGRLTVAQAAHHQVLTRLGQLAQQLKELESKMGEKKQLEEGLREIKGEHDVADDLARMLQANRFQAFVQSEALRALAEGASQRLDQLSAGRYRLQVAGNSQDFEVVDKWNAEDARSVKTLSGGETFLASLALALTLAERLPGLAAGRPVALDSIFLDEGFGSLDPEALDQAADALDSLRSDNRLVCVITHLRELADRLPARVRVHKSPFGSTVEIE